MKKINLKSILFFLVLLFLLTSCQQQKQEDILKKDVVALLEQYRRGVNECDTVLLNRVLSSKFLAASGRGKEEQIELLIKRDYLIDTFQITALQVENYKIVADLLVQGSKLYFPSLKPPLFQNNPALMEGVFKQKSKMVFIYENDGLRVFAEEEGIMFQDFSWGQTLPDLTFLSIDKETVLPGDELSVSFYSGKGYDNEIMFIYLNERLLHSYYAETSAVLSEERQTIRVPSQLTKNSVFELTIAAFAGKMDINKPQGALLKGAVIKKIIIPVK